MSKLRALSIDGGGTKALFSAAFLAAIEGTERRIVDNFDLIVGTSAGGIIALGLALEFGARDMLEFFNKNAATIFQQGPFRWSRRIRALFGPRYDAGKLDTALQDFFGERRLGAARTRLVIPAFNPAVGDVHLLKTAHHERFSHDYLERAWEVARATSAAPTYWRAHRTGLATELVDGGLWANNPSMVAVTEAIGVLGRSPIDIHLLSVGTTRTKLSVGRQTRTAGGVVQWGHTIAKDLFMHIQVIVAHNQACHIVGQERYVRVDPSTSTQEIPLDDATAGQELIAFGEQAARHAMPRVLPLFFDGPVEPFRPCHELK